MPYVTCSNCGDNFHIKVGIKADEWNKKFPLSEDGNRYETCYYCWKELKELDVVEVFKLPEAMLDNVEVGDCATVILIHSDNAFELECVNENSTTKWTHVIERKFLKYILI